MIAPPASTAASCTKQVFQAQRKRNIRPDGWGVTMKNTPATNHPVLSLFAIPLGKILWFLRVLRKNVVTASYNSDRTEKNLRVDSLRCGTRGMHKNALKLIARIFYCNVSCARRAGWKRIKHAGNDRRSKFFRCSNANPPSTTLGPAMPPINLTDMSDPGSGGTTFFRYLPALTF